jgi:mRNA guanylyltransferase
MQSLDKIDFCQSKTWQLHSIDANNLNRILCNWWTNTEIEHFPGPQPVSIERKHLSSLSTNNYRVCEKTDGERHLFACVKYLDSTLAVLINRKQEVILLPIIGANDIFAGTLLDGEIVKNKSKNTYKYIVYDCVRAFGESTISGTHMERMQAATTIVSQIQTTQRSLFTFCIKEFYPFSKMKDYVEIVVPTLTHDIDGYIFTPNNEPVRIGTHFTMFKWKQRLDNTVDFLVKGDDVYIMKKNKLCLLNGVSVKIPSAMSEISNAILECEYVNKLSWTAVRVRQDKTHPNGFLTYTKTLNNIYEDIKLNEFYQG